MPRAPNGAWLRIWICPARGSCDSPGMNLRTKNNAMIAVPSVTPNATVVFDQAGPSVPITGIPECAPRGEIAIDSSAAFEAALQTCSNVTAARMTETPKVPRLRMELDWQILTQPYPPVHRRRSAHYGSCGT